MSNTVHVFDYLGSPSKYAVAGTCVDFGEEPFLKRLALKQLRLEVLGEGDIPYASFEGGSAEWRDVLDELSTRALFGGGGRRLALIDDADEFVRQHRERLEEYVEHPKSGSVLVMDVAAWPSNTRLYKAVDQKGLSIDCRAPQKTVGKRQVLDEQRLLTWLAAWARQHHDVKLPSKAAQLLLELVGPEFGILDQDLAKLALFAGPGGQITPEMVHDIVGGWKTKTIWELLDAACDGEAAEALRQLDRLLQSEDHALALFGPIAWSLRRFAAATRIVERTEREGRKPNLRKALEEAGFRAWPQGALERAERQLKQLTRHRAGQLYRWLLEADLALKGSHSNPHRSRFVLEQLLIRMSKQLAPKPVRR
jgi:DNA polymerase-3 subunit delta